MEAEEATSVRDVMSTDVLTVGLEDSIREAALRMSERNLGAAMVEPDKAQRLPGIISARELLYSVAAGRTPTPSAWRTIGRRA